MSWNKWIDDRLFVLEQVVHQALRRLPQDQREEILQAVVNTCEGKPGTAAISEHMLDCAEADGRESESPGPGVDRLIRYAEDMHRIYGDRSRSE